MPVPLGRSPEASSDDTSRPREAGVIQARLLATPHRHLIPGPGKPTPFPSPPRLEPASPSLHSLSVTPAFPPPTGAGWEEAVPGALPSLGHTGLYPAGPVGQAGPNHRADRCVSMRPRLEVVSNLLKLPDLADSPPHSTTELTSLSSSLPFHPFVIPLPHF